MKKLFLLLAFISNCYAEPFRYDKPIICDTTEAVYFVIEEFKEKPVFTGVPLGEGNARSLIILTENRTTGTWTLIQTNDKNACIIAVGKNITS